MRRVLSLKNSKNVILSEVEGTRFFCKKRGCAYLAGKYLRQFTILPILTKEIQIDVPMYYVDCLT